MTRHLETLVGLTKICGVQCTRAGGPHQQLPTAQALVEYVISKSTQPRSQGDESLCTQRVSIQIVAVPKPPPREGHLSKFAMAVENLGSSTAFSALFACVLRRSPLEKQTPLRIPTSDQNFKRRKLYPALEIELCTSVPF